MQNIRLLRWTPQTTSARIKMPIKMAVGIAIRVHNHFTFTLKWSDLYKITFWPIWSEVKWFQFSKKWSEVKWSENKSLYGNLKWSEVTFTSQNFEVKWSEVRSKKVTSLHFKVIKKWRKSDFGQRKITLKWSEVTLYLQ